jgi:hypothetical protein
MFAKLKVLVLALFALAALGAVTAGVASAKAPKPELILKENGKAVPDNTQVKGGWAVSIETQEEPEYYYGCELEGSMKLTTNSSTKADLASGSVGIPTEECGEYSLEEETGAPTLALAKRAHHARHRARAKHRARSLGADTEVVPTLEEPDYTGGQLLSEEMTVKHTATLELSKPLEVSGKEIVGGKAVSCKYATKTKMKGIWPAEEYPGTADVETEFDFKVVKGSAKGCVKEEEGFIEAWLGPNYKELEAELT